jgi:hypothetical protein
LSLSWIPGERVSKVHTLRDEERQGSAREQLTAQRQGGDGLVGFSNQLLADTALTFFVSQSVIVADPLSQYS